MAGLMDDPMTPAPPPSMMAPAAPALPAMVPYASGIVKMMSNTQLEAEERKAAETANNQPLVQSLASHVRTAWSAALDAKRMTVESRMLSAVRRRRGQYDDNILAEIRKTGGSELWMHLTSSKCRTASGWLLDVFQGTQSDRAWSIDPTPIPDLPPTVMQSVTKLATYEAQQYEQLTGQVVGPREMEQVVGHVKDRILINAKKRAKEATDRMAAKMEDQLVEGGFDKMLKEMMDDVVTFPAAIVKGPVVKKKARLQWVKDVSGEYVPQVQDEIMLEWVRVDPFNFYPAPQISDIDDGYCIERHRLTRTALNEYIGVDGYNAGAIKAVLDEHGRGGLNEWLYVDTAKAVAEGKSLSSMTTSPEVTIDAIQYWGSVQGKLLREWGMSDEQVPDASKEYSCEVWLIGNWVIKATINADPLGRKPYYKVSYEEVPGTFWGNSVVDLCMDSQDQCNTAARAIANNMSLASGPQVGLNVDRLPAGYNVTQMTPWQVHQFTSDPYGSTAPAIDFFQPKSILGELLQIFVFFSNQADDNTGVPKYMAGDATGSGALRTSSGMSMLMTNAGKSIKQVVANIDTYVMQPLIERLYYYNMRFGTDPELKGDVQIRARGVNAMMVKETQQMRANELLNIISSNPTVQGIVGPEAVAELLRQSVKRLDMDSDSIVPPPEVIRGRQYQQQMQDMQAQQMDRMAAGQDDISLSRGPDGAVTGAKIMPRPSQPANAFAPMRQ